MNVDQIKASEDTNRLYRFLLYVGIIVMAFNLRPAITSVGPVIGLIRDDVGLSNWSAGVITSLPLLTFAGVSPIAPKVGNRFSNERALLFGLFLLLFGIGIRSITSVSLLYVGTFLVGIGIAFCNVLVPGAIKEKFPQKVELMTGIYSVSMNGFAAIASGLSIPIAVGLGAGWRMALLVWIIPVFLAVFIWVYLSRVHQKSEPGDQAKVQYHEQKYDTRIWTSPVAWHVALFMGFQSFLFYVTISWLPEMLVDYGVSIATGGWMLSFMQAVGLPFSFLVPVIAGRFKSQWWLVCILGVLDIIGFSGLIFGDSYGMMVASVTLIGIGLGSGFPLALAFLGIRARNARQASILSGMAQSFGYLLAAVGPMIIGYVFDMAHTWAMPLVMMMGIAVCMIIFGSLAGRDRYVGD